MKVFVAGATGAVGKQLLPLLVDRGHQVIATSRSAAKLDIVRRRGAEPVILDGLDREAVAEAVRTCRPDAIIHQMTALASMRSLKNFDEEFAITNRLRIEGTANLLAAAQSAGVRTFIAQSYTGWPNRREGGRIKTEDNPLDPSPPKSMAKTLEAILALERMTLNATGITGIALRYGSLYGPGTSISTDGEIVERLLERKFPVVGGGAGVWSFLHVADAARATCAALERGQPGIYNVVDDDPAEVAVWLPELARVVGAPKPRRVPAWIARFAIGEAGVLMMTRIRGSANAKARRVLSWTPEYSTWRDGFRLGLSGTRATNKAA